MTHRSKIKTVLVCMMVFGAAGLALLGCGTNGSSGGGQADPDRLDGGPVLAVLPESVVFQANARGEAPSGQEVEITNETEDTLTWTVSTDSPWLMADPSSGDTGTETDTITIRVDITGLDPGIHFGTVTVTAQTVAESPKTVSVTLRLCGGPCVFVDAQRASHAVSSLLFGDQIEWLKSGTWIWDRPISATCLDPRLDGGAPRFELMSEFTQLGLTLLRYPGGIPSDFFHWAEAVGPTTQRRPQIDPWASTAPLLVRECPVFGPDEFVEVAMALGADIMITANAGMGRAQEAADWLSYYQAQGVSVDLWEIGNEVYIPGNPPGDPNGEPYALAAVYMTAEEYAQAFDAFAAALRAVNPLVKVGMVGFEDTEGVWNPVVLQNVREPVDFLAVHIAYAPAACYDNTPTDEVFRALMAAPVLVRWKLDMVEGQVAQYATGESADLELAVTEHASLFLLCGVNDLEQVERNKTLGSALFSALSYNLFIADPKITMANHMNMSHPLFQAAITTSTVDGYSNPVRSAFFYVFRLYAETADGIYVPAHVFNAPTFATTGYGIVPPLSGVPTLDSIAVLAPDSERLWAFVVNRDLTQDVVARVGVDGFAPQGISSVTAEVLNGTSYSAVNSQADPTAVTLTSRPLTPSRDFDFLFPAHSLVRLTFQ